MYLILHITLILKKILNVPIINLHKIEKKMFLKLFGNKFQLLYSFVIFRIEK